jgi:hypothetical protein
VTLPISVPPVTGERGRGDSLVSCLGVGVNSAAGGRQNASAVICDLSGGILRDPPAGLCWRLLGWRSERVRRRPV